MTYICLFVKKNQNICSVPVQKERRFHLREQAHVVFPRLNYKNLANSLLGRINAIENADVIKDIIVMPPFHFHSLRGDMEGFFAIDVNGRRDKWRIILQPLDENEEVFEPCHIDEIATVVRIVEIKEVSAHYE